jgi:hypothetical protein
MECPFEHELRDLVCVGDVSQDQLGNPKRKV